MRVQTSPGGSIFPYPYKGGEIHCLKYGTFVFNEEALFAVIKAEETFIAGQNQQLLIWVDLYETRLTDRVLIEFTESVNRLRPHIRKLAVVGCSFLRKQRLLYYMKKPGTQLPSIRFFSDPEAAKTWLVTETY